ncbi:HTH-type transcriptional regulator AcrR [Caulifigura coniformis]|uniref:HTH-type transcriptional regulator AcrR n=1 Tax=Caulifigura coniformis TaxID=2527983 RepID=A0A517SLK1_9PLAN|nr:TetR/AcrR family transcriptional regulator [Caulifigura coniformis]QDT57003.1 HTH-type transcriptional regulator AcrR [Caulifigura coniformis]
MKVSREQAARNRQHVVETASRCFREKGFDGIGIADLMREAGLTHGGFYGNFDSKEDLIAETCERALGRALGRWKALADAHPDRPMEAIAKDYLTVRHRDSMGEGCFLAALGSDLVRRDTSVRSRFTSGFKTLIDALTSAIPGRSRAARRERALGAWSTLIGALILARVVDDDELSREILGAGLAAVNHK